MFGFFNASKDVSWLKLGEARGSVSSKKFYLQYPKVEFQAENCQVVLPLIDV